MLVWIHPSGELYRMLQRTLTHKEGLKDVQRFCDAIVESSFFETEDERDRHLRAVFHTITSLLQQNPKRFPQPIPRHFPGSILSHPLLLGTYFEYPSPWRVYAKQALKKRLDPFREELMAKSWHPSRFQYWCQDIDEQKFDVEQGIQGPVPELRGLHASWNISWL
jgi:hypothetical protein